MNRPRLIACGLTFLCIAGPVWAQGELDATVPTAPPLGGAVETVPLVNTGDQIGIACTALTASDADSDDVRVVLTISAQPGEAQPGYNKVLATEEEVGHGAVQVRIPDVPDLENRTVNVDVYVMGDKGAESCDAGHMKIVRQRSPSQPGSEG